MTRPRPIPYPRPGPAPTQPRPGTPSPSQPRPGPSGPPTRPHARVKIFGSILTCGLAVLFYLGAIRIIGAAWPTLTNDLIVNLSVGVAIGMLTGWAIGRLAS